MFRSIKPVLFSLLLLFAFASCEKEVSVENGVDLTGGSQSGTGVFILDGSPAACATPLINGDYIVGTPLDVSNSVIITATVTTVGTYTISTGLINGIRFTGSGTFASTGTQTITLLGTGTPAAASTGTYIPGTVGCSFLITATTGSVGPVTEGTLDCTTATTSGVYTQSIGLTAANTVTIPVNVTTAGSYSITTTATNGVTFSGSGTLATGAQNIILTGSGTPTNAGATAFPVSLGASSCNFSITFLPAPPPAVFTLVGAPGACNPITVSGSYSTGNALVGATNNAVVQANVTTAGLYTITTSTVNGMSFTASGVFTGTGPQSVTLAGSGTPVAIGTNTFTVGTGGCTFPVTVTAPSSPCTGLVDGTFVMTGQFTLNGFSFGTSFGSQFQVTIQDSPLQIDVFFPGTNPPAPGTYPIGTVTMNCLYVAGTTAIDWNATAGSVYVSTDTGGNTVVEFCNISFTGTNLIGGPNLSSTGAGKMIL